MTPRQLRAARAGLDIKVEDLAAKALVSPNTITRFERGQGEMRRATADVIRRVLEAEGTFFPDGETVKFTTPQQAA